MSQVHGRGSHEAKSSGATGVGTGLAGDVNTNLKIFFGVPLACKRHPPFISAPCRPKPNLHTLVHAHTYVRHACRIDISRRTKYAVARRRTLVIYSVNSNKSHKFVRSIFTRRRRSSREYQDWSSSLPFLTVDNPTNNSFRD